MAVVTVDVAVVMAGNVISSVDVVVSLFLNVIKTPCWCYECMQLIMAVTWAS